MAGNNLSSDELFANAHEMAGGNTELLAQLLEQVNDILRRNRQQITPLPRNAEEALAQRLMSRLVESDDSETGQGKGKGRAQSDPEVESPSIDVPRARMQSIRQAGPSNMGLARPPGTRGFHAAVARGQFIIVPTPEEEDEQYRAMGIAPPTLPEARVHVNEKISLEMFIDAQIRNMEEADARKEGRKAFRAEASRQRENARRWREESPKEFEQVIDDMEQTQVQEPLQNAAAGSRSRPPIVTGRVDVTARRAGRIEGVGPVSAVGAVPQYAQVPQSRVQRQSLQAQLQRWREAAGSTFPMSSLHRLHSTNAHSQQLGASTSAVIDNPVPSFVSYQSSHDSPADSESNSQSPPPYQTLRDNTAPPAYDEEIVNRPHLDAAGSNDPYRGAENIIAPPFVPSSWASNQRAPGTDLPVQNQPGSQGFTIPSRRNAQATPSASGNPIQRQAVETWSTYQQAPETQSYSIRQPRSSGLMMPGPANAQARQFDTVNRLQQSAGQAPGDGSAVSSGLLRAHPLYQSPYGAHDHNHSPPQIAGNDQSRPSPSNDEPAARPRTIRPTHGHTRHQNAGPDVQARRSRRGGDIAPSGLE